MFYTPALILAPNLNIFQRILWQPLIKEISKFPTLEISPKLKYKKENSFSFSFFTLHTQKQLTQLENSLKIDLSSSQKTQRLELISSSMGWFAVVSYLISDDKLAIDSCLSLFVSREIMEITLIFDSTRYDLLWLFISLHFYRFTRILYLEKLFEMNRLCLSFYLF